MTLRWPQPGAPTAHCRFALDEVSDVALQLRALADDVEGGGPTVAVLRRLDLVRALLVAEATR